MSNVEEKVRAEREEEMRLAEIGQKRDQIAKANADFFLNTFREAVKNGPTEWDPEYDYDPLWDQTTAEEKATEEANWRKFLTHAHAIGRKWRYFELFQWRLERHRERRAAIEKKAREDARRARNSAGWTLERWRRRGASGSVPPPPLHTLDITAKHLGDLHVNEIEELAGAPECQVRRSHKRRKWSSPTCRPSGEPSRAARRREGLWNSPQCPVARGSTQPDPIPSAKYLAEIARREQRPPLSRRARMEARARIAAIQELQRRAFEAALGFTAAAARRKAALRRIEWAKAWTRRPRPPKRVPGIISWTLSPEYRLIKAVRPAKRVPTRTRNKRQLTPGHPRRGRKINAT